MAFDCSRVNNKFGKHFRIRMINLFPEYCQKAARASLFNRIRYGPADIFEALHIGQNLIGSFRRHLTAVFSIHLISVILRRIMAGCYHDTGKCFEISYGIGKNRYRTKFVGKKHTDAGMCQYAGGRPGKFRGKPA